jgi:transposase
MTKLFTIEEKRNNVTKKYNKKEICCHLKFGNCLKNTKVKDYQVVQAILYRLKTGCQWRELPMKEFFRVRYRWQSVYYHFKKWSTDGSWEYMWQNALNRYKSDLDLSSIQLDGTHTPSKRGGEAVDYQGRKKCKTSNMLIIADSRGIPVVCSEAISGNHNDAYELKENVDQMLQSLEASNIDVDGLFLNADAGFDTTEFREYCASKDIVGNIAINPRNGNNEDYLFDELLYKCRFVIERTNAWLDAFKALLVRFETNKNHWKALHLLAFTVILLRQL